MAGEKYAKHVTFDPASGPCGGPTVLEIGSNISVNSANQASLGYSVIDTVSHHCTVARSWLLNGFYSILSDTLLACTSILCVSDIYKD